MPNPKMPVKGRDSVRFAISIPVEYEKTYSIAKEEVIKKTTARDLSGSGIQFETDENIPKGIKLSLKINLPHMTKFLTVHAEVTNSKKIGDNLYDIGAKFLEMSREARDAINMFYYINRFKGKGPLATYQK